MQDNFITLSNQSNLIHGAVLHPLKINRDERGSLTENLKASWSDVFTDNFPFGQNYCSVTKPGFARDEEFFHNHPTKQTDRFSVVKGSCVFVMYDARDDSPTKGVLNLFLMGEMVPDEQQFLLLIPKGVYHGFTCVGNEPVYLLGFPDQVYDPQEEGRVPIKESGAKFTDGSDFSWAKVREHFNK